MTPDKLKVTGAARELNLATGTSRTTKKWTNKTLTWRELLDKLSEPVRTPETLAEYAKMPKSEKGRVKDVGGFVGGWLKGGRRRPGNVQNRTMLVLDADTPSEHLLGDMELLCDYAYAYYSTHSHTTEHPRYRIVIPLNRAVYPDEYEPIIRQVASELGMSNFDDTTYQSERLMYWPSVSSDADYVFGYNDGSWLDPDEVLAQYDDWRDASMWPESETHQVKRRNDAKKQGDPLGKKGVIGAFCRAYDIERAIDELLSDVYEPTANPDRYTYAQGSTAGGLVIYEDVFAYSNHGTDPVGGQLVNAFDLVRIHKFSDLDEDVKADTATPNLPSYKAMMDYARELPEVSEALRKEALGDFDDLEDIEVPEDEEDPQEWLEVTNKGININPFLLARQVRKEIPTFYNAREFLRYDPTTGIWRGDAEEHLKAYITAKLGKEARKMHLSEAVDGVKNQGYKYAEFEDGDLSKIVLANGVYDLDSDTFTAAFDKNIHARVAHPVQYDAEADCPTFDKFLDLQVGEETKPFIYEWIGYCFYRSYPLQHMLFIPGKGGTGKSTLVGIMQQLVGHEAYSSVPLVAINTERFATINMHQKTANFDNDAKPKYLADADLLKKLTGEDPIYADRKNKDPINFYNYAKLTFSMNAMPPMRDFSGALERRMLIVRMGKKITGEVKRKAPLHKIREELSGIFNKAMEGLRRALKNEAFTVTDAMIEEVEQWVAGNDVVSLFIEDECERVPDKHTPVADAYSDYNRYCRESGYHALSRNAFGQRLEELGYQRKNVKIDEKAVKCWIGIRTKSAEFFD